MDHGISSDVFTMHLHRFAWMRIEQITNDNPALNGTESYMWEFMFDTYSRTQASAVRRQADTDPQVVSLGRLISEVAETPELITRDFWLGLWRQDDDGDLRRLAERGWADQYAGGVGDHLDPAIPGGDLVKLRHGSKRVKEYVDQHVAHMDARTIGGRVEPPDAPTKTGGQLPTLSDVHDAIDLIGGLFTKYGNMLTASTWGELTPALQHDWEAVFRVPWIVSDPED
jgi:hypothetical protein